MSLYELGVIIDPETEMERRFNAHEVAKVWRR